MILVNLGMVTSTLGVTSSKSPALGLGQMLIIVLLTIEELLLVKSALTGAPKGVKIITGVTKKILCGVIALLNISSNSLNRIKCQENCSCLALESEIINNK